MAPVSYQTILRSRATRAASAELRVTAGRARAEARARRGRTRSIEDEVARARARHDALAAELGSWPYWSPPTRDLWNVLVPVPDAA